MAPIILVTGANRGVGFCIAQVLARQNPTSTILVAARTHGSASDAVQKLMTSKAHATFEPMVLDVTSDHSIYALLAMIKERYRRLDGKCTINMVVLLYMTLMYHHSPHQQRRHRSRSESRPFRLSSGFQLSSGYKCHLSRTLDLAFDASAA